MKEHILVHKAFYYFVFLIILTFLFINITISLSVVPEKSFLNEALLFIMGIASFLLVISLFALAVRTSVRLLFKKGLPDFDELFKISLMALFVPIIILFVVSVFVIHFLVYTYVPFLQPIYKFVFDNLNNFSVNLTSALALFLTFVFAIFLPIYLLSRATRRYDKLKWFRLGPAWNPKKEG